MKKLIFAALLFMGLNAEAQYNVSFVKPTIDGNKFRVTLQMSAVKNFAIGSNNLRFNYPVENLANPVIVSDAFADAAFRATNLVGSNLEKGLLTVNTAYYGKTKANILPISKKGTDLVTLEFDIIKPADKIDLKWRINNFPKTAIVGDDKKTAIIATATELPVKLTADVKTSTVKNNSFGLNISPNPTSDVANLTFESTSAQTMEFALTDAAGKVINNQTFAAVKGRNMFTFDMKNLASGIYYISCAENVEFTQKVIKQ
ncbi:MAG: T9SS type A sorting domain-containing protein [Saprospiraceae bacterium]